MLARPWGCASRLCRKDGARNPSGAGERDHEGGTSRRPRDFYDCLRVEMLLWDSLAEFGVCSGHLGGPAEMRT